MTTTNPNFTSSSCDGVESPPSGAITDFTDDAARIPFPGLLLEAHRARAGLVRFADAVAHFGRRAAVGKFVHMGQFGGVAQLTPTQTGSTEVAA